MKQSKRNRECRGVREVPLEHRSEAREGEPCRGWGRSLPGRRSRQCKGPEVGASGKQLKVWGPWEARSGKGMAVCVRPWAFTVSEWEPLQGPEGGQLWGVGCVPQSETSPV